MADLSIRSMIALFLTSFGGGSIKGNPAEFARLIESPAGPVAAHIRASGNDLKQRAQELAPVSPEGNHGRSGGYLKAKIVARSGVDEGGPYTEVVTTAMAPDGFGYGRWQELHQHYMARAMDETGLDDRIYE